MNYKTKVVSLAILASALLGWLTSPLISSVRESYPPPALGGEVSTLSESLGKGISVAVLGGYRNISANLVWIRMYADWQALRKNEVLAKIRLAVALNPDSEFFWIDGARIIANDMPVWEVGADNMNSLFETQVGSRVRFRYARLALNFLDKAPAALAQSQAILKEKGVIYWKKLDDLPGALAYFGEAISLPGAPYYMSRVYAELLIKNGQLEEAYNFLKTHYASLPDNNMQAMKPLVQKRIQDLEALLQEEK